ncbi:MAG TPA: indolepyruvate oxidoreductase subunit beta [Spirochaetota bacterium]|nr:indolepyruvate oxidoreductase subunit beta [Spirochaetota bacterium]HOS31978.1 indolepyruvate oxidoreductase subunit beta [Spirochaetota bacterium]HOS55252.1 indolepyruvate oxidoreductase subunit beta [Spirochaetota bacterium]HPK60933.1 indolepyruvate oxidoreductase subunit beta [Spirochaetota bacterium]HQF77745.1 indolepyruvate oxidoreductase subunit beta [Spirochaetota bacterium]
MDRIFNILIVGVGGQGIILASDIASKAAALAGFDSKKSEIHGMSQRGGSVFSHVRYGSKVYSPVIPLRQADILVSLEEMETVRWADFCSKDTIIILAKNRVAMPESKDYPENIEEALKKTFKNIITVDPKEIVQKIGKPKFFNVALLGAVSNYTKIDEPSWKKAIEEEVPAGAFDENWNAFSIGKSVIK